MPASPHVWCRPDRRSGFRGPLPVLLFFALLFLAFIAPALAQPYVAGQTYYGRRSYIEYRAGDIPLILTAPHGGDLTPSEIPDRSGTGIVTVTDTNTRELAIACYDEIVARTGRYPHLIISHLARLKLDPNRDIAEGALGDPEAERAWNDFHGFITSARDAARAAHGFGQLVDLHGHGHDIARLELGYALGADELNVSDTALNNPGYARMSTLRTLLLSRPGVPFSDLLRGPRSLGSLFVDRAVPAWPSSTYPSPGTADFFDGGHIVRTHSCILDNDTVHGVQIESHYTGVRDSSASRASFANAFSQVLQPYLYHNYGYSLGTLSLYALRPPASSTLARGGAGLTLTVDRTGYRSFASTLALSFGGTAVLGTDYAVSRSRAFTLIAALLKNHVGIVRRRTVRRLRQHPAAQPSGVGRSDHALQRRRHQHRAGQEQQFVVAHRVAAPPTRESAVDRDMCERGVEIEAAPRCSSHRIHR